MDLKQETKNIAIVFGAIVTSHGLQAYIPAGIEPLHMVLGGIGITYFAINSKL